MGAGCELSRLNQSLSLALPITTPTFVSGLWPVLASQLVYKALDQDASLGPSLCSPPDSHWDL